MLSARTAAVQLFVIVYDGGSHSGRAREKYNRSVDTASLRRKLVSEAKPNVLPQAERTKSHAGLPLLRRLAHASGSFIT